MHKRISNLSILLIFLCFSLVAPNEVLAAKVLSAKDTLRLNSISGFKISPDGKWILYGLRTRDMEDKDLKSEIQIWRVDIEGKNNQQMTFSDENSTSPAWFPDGRKIAFLRSADSKSQIYFMYVDGGEAWQVTSHKESIQSFEISDDGQKILFTSREPLSEEEEEKQKRKDDTEIVDEKFRMSHLWIYDIASKKTEQLTNDKYTVSDAHWSPDAKQIVYVSRETTKNDDGYTADMWVVNLETKKSKKLYENPGPDNSPRWSPDGKTIAFASNTYPDTSTMLSKLYLIPATGGTPKVMLEDFDRSFGSPIWSPDGKTIYWGAGDKTTATLFSVELGSGKVKRFDAPVGSNRQWQLSKDGTRWLWSRTAPSWPGELYTAGLDLKNPLRLTDANPWLKKEGFQQAKLKVIKWKNNDEQWIEGVLTLPVGYEEGKKYPLILNPHGGPSGVVTESFSTTNQYLAGNGFMILQPNFRGSSGYGQEFVNANRKLWGIRDYDDCMTGVDYCIDQGWADPDRLICYGWSYGGYMSFWIVTQTDRFKAVSPGAGLPNLYSMYSTTDIPRYLKWFFGTPWDNPEVYEKHSPIRYVKQVKSPVLIMHGGNDARVPPTQAVEFYQALKDLGKDVTFVRFPREGHGIREPLHHIDRLRHYLRFFCKHVGLEPVTDKPEKK